MSEDIRVDTWTWGTGGHWAIRVTSLVTGRVINAKGQGHQALRDATERYVEQARAEHQQ